MRVPAAYNVLPDRDAPRDAEEKREWLKDVDAAILKVSTGESTYSCNALPSVLRAIYAEAVFTRGDDIGFDTPTWAERYEKYLQVVQHGAPENESYHSRLRAYRVAALRRFRSIIRRTIPISKRKRGKHD